jgi:3-deoxy-D-manno-octulosonate 8-phosphate phosphatase KdsC-like HAD superfamily phosphatase
MTRQAFMSLAAGVSVITGLSALLAPEQIAAVFGVTLNDAGLAQTRLLGAAYLGYAAIVWFGKDVRDHAARRAMALGNVVSYALSAVVTTAAVVLGLAGMQSWALVVLEVIFASAWGYFAFIDRAEVAMVNTK